MERLVRENKRREDKNWREEVTRQTGLVTPCTWGCAFLRDTARASEPSHKTPTEAK